MDYRQALQTGTPLGGRYRIRAVAARDDFSITYAADAEENGARCLVQEFFPSELASRNSDGAISPKSPLEAAALSWGCEQLRAEGRILPGLSHPALLRLLDTVEANETVYRVFGPVDGIALAAWAGNLKRRPTQDELDRLLVPVLGALEALHGAGLIHADLRPERISLNAAGHPLLAPFGQARWGVAARSNRLHAVVTPGYTPPEQYVFDVAAQGPWTDIYGLAATLYRLMMGRPPADALTRRMNDDFQPTATAALHEYRFGFRQAVDLALSMPQARRPQTIANWRAMLLGAAQEAAAPPAPAPAPVVVDAVAPAAPVAKPAAASTPAAAKPAAAPAPAAKPVAAPALLVQPGMMPTLLAKPPAAAAPVAKSAAPPSPVAQPPAAPAPVAKPAAPPSPAAQPSAAPAPVAKPAAPPSPAAQPPAAPAPATMPAQAPAPLPRPAPAPPVDPATVASAREAQPRSMAAPAQQTIEGYPEWTRPAEAPPTQAPPPRVDGMRWGLVAVIIGGLLAVIAGAAIMLPGGGGGPVPVPPAKPIARATEGSPVVAPDRDKRALETEIARQEIQQRAREADANAEAEAARRAQQARLAAQAKAARDAEAVARAAADAEAARSAAAEAEAARKAAAEAATSKAEAARRAKADAERLEAARRAQQDRLAAQAKAAQDAEAAARAAAETEAAKKAAAEADARRNQLAAIAGETGRDRLLEIAAADPAQTAAVNRRLGELGFIEIATTAGRTLIRPGAGESFADCSDCPALVAVPAGEVRIGAHAEEVGRRDDEDDTAGPGGQPVLIRVPRPFAIGRSEVTRGEFARFIADTGHVMTGGCHARYGGWRLVEDLSWTSPGFVQDDRHPVVCVSWLDAKAYVAWLSKSTGHRYRLPTEAEWEYAARALLAPVARPPRFASAEGEAELCRHANVADAAAKEVNPSWSVAPCSDGFRQTAPIASFRANAWGLHDTAGNVWEWMEDCYRDSLRHLKDAVAGPASAPDVCGAMGGRVLKGGSWSDMPAFQRPASRIMSPRDVRDEIVGFRVARELDAGGAKP